MKLGLFAASLVSGKSLYDGPMGGVGKCFLQSIYECVPIQESPICDETNENFNPVTCALKLNVCLLDSMTGIGECVENGKTGVEPFYGPMDGAGICFAKAVHDCKPASESPICDEEHPDFNPMACAIKLNRCLINTLAQIPDCVENLPEEGLPLPEPSEKPYYGPMDGAGICFAKAVHDCKPAAENGICSEEHPDYNPIACAIKLNRCLIHTLSQMPECMENLPEEGLPLPTPTPERSVAPYPGPDDGHYRDYIYCFVDSLVVCIPVNDTPLCDEEHEYYNPVACAIKLNACLLDSLKTIETCVENMPQ